MHRPALCDLQVETESACSTIWYQRYQVHRLDNMFSEDEFMTQIVPSIGVVVGTLMFLSPLKAVMDMRKNGRIGVSKTIGISFLAPCSCKGPTIVKAEVSSLPPVPLPCYAFSIRLRSRFLLQDLNPIPFPVVVANCVAWVAYAIVSKDPYVFLANDPGLLLGLFYTLSAYGYADVKVFSCPSHESPCL